MSTLFGSHEQPKMQDTTKESRQAAESDRQRRLRAAGFRSTVLTNYMPANSPAMKQFMGN